MNQKPTTFQLVSQMNEAFGNPKGDPLNIDWERTRRQFKNIGHEFCELMTALGLDPACVENILGAIDRNTNPEQFNQPVDLKQVRDSSRDVVVFADGGHHFMGIDADRDMVSVIDGVMSRFVKDEEDENSTILKHAAKGVTEFYFEGDYPTKVMKSYRDQPDAPKGKFLKSASYKEPVFYDVVAQAEQDRADRLNQEDSHFNYMPSQIVSPEAQKKLAEAGADVHLINGTSGDQAKN